MLYRVLENTLSTLLLLLMVITPTWAEQSSAFVVYDDELKNNWVNWSWAEVTLSHPAGGAKPIKVEGEAWTALALHHDTFSIEPYTKLVFFINGGSAGGQDIAIKLTVDGKTVTSNYMIRPQAKTWAVAEVPLDKIADGNTKIDGIWFQAQADKIKPYYITRIQFE